jgi:hypothetical protein
MPYFGIRSKLPLATKDVISHEGRVAFRKAGKDAGATELDGL